MASGIKDKVAILGMGCSKFGERWDKEADDLMVEAYEEALADAGIETKQINAAWLSTAIEDQHVGKSGVPLAIALRLPYIPVTRYLLPVPKPTIFQLLFGAPLLFEGPGNESDEEIEQKVETVKQRIASLVRQGRALREKRMKPEELDLG